MLYKDMWKILSSRCLASEDEQSELKILDHYRHLLKILITGIPLKRFHELK